MPSAKNHPGIFDTKRAKLLAIKYNLELYNKNAYMNPRKYITYNDVLIIVDNLWLDHIEYFTPLTITVSLDEYNNLYRHYYNNL